MIRMRWFVGVVSFCCVVIAAQEAYIWRLEMDARLDRQIHKLDSDQIRDLFFAAQQAQAALEGEKTRAFLAGLSEAQSKPELTQVWHAGYDRGQAVGVEQARVEVWSEVREQAAQNK